MKLVSLVVFGVVIVLFGQCAQATEPGLLQGYVRDSESGGPIGIAYVLSLSNDSTFSHTSSGLYQLSLNVGQYDFEVHAAGYEFAYFTASIFSLQTTLVDVYLDRIAYGYDTDVTEINFGQVNSVSDPQTITITNTGELSLDFASINLVGLDSNQFEVISDSDETFLDPGEFRVVTVRMTANAPGYYSAGLEIRTMPIFTGESDDYVQTVALLGTKMLILPIMFDDLVVVVPVLPAP